MAIVPLDSHRRAAQATFCDDQSFADNRESPRVTSRTSSAQRRAEVHAGWGREVPSTASTRRASSPRASDSRSSPEGPRQRPARGRHLRQPWPRGLRRPKGLTSPAAGVVTAFATGRRAVVHGHRQRQHRGERLLVAAVRPEKIQRAQDDGAAAAAADCIYLVDCSGLFLPEQSKSFPGARGAQATSSR